MNICSAMLADLECSYSDAMTLFRDEIAAFCLPRTTGCSDRLYNSVRGMELSNEFLFHFFKNITLRLNYYYKHVQDPYVI